ncbi:MAG: CDP-glycerol glycerophosphotransferase family protein [Clostridiales bacterium]|nr:CDP-glycerol glycerophosphotransferase family protein [Clostridiales bacterium]
MEYSLIFRKIHIRANKIRFVADGEFAFVSALARPRVILHFMNGEEDRRIPLVIAETAVADITDKADRQTPLRAERDVHLQDDASPDGVETLSRCASRDEQDARPRKLTFHSDYTYLLDYLFWKSRKSGNDIRMYVNIFYVDEYAEKVSLSIDPAVLDQDGLVYKVFAEGNSLRIVHQPGWQETLLTMDQSTQSTGLWKAKAYVKKAFSFLDEYRTSLRDVRKVVRIPLIAWKRGQLIHSYSRIRSGQPVVPERITFISARRTELSGNFAFVCQKLAGDDRLDMQMFLTKKDLYHMSGAEIERLALLCATSRVLVLDEYTPFVHYITIGPETKVVQLWHACGAFKAFGFTRLGKTKAPSQKTALHRNYDYVTVSTKNVCVCHSEGFGIPTANVVPTGIPRTDVFFDEDYKTRTRDRLQEKYPVLKGRKVILFAPTFRGHDRDDAYYPMERFQVGSFMDAVGEEYVLLIKHHPFVTAVHPVPEAYKDRVLDLSAETELNDLLFVADLIITDYSSLVFEASLLELPMLFYTFDLEDYISERDFYFDFESFVPGRFFYTQEELERAVIRREYSREKTEAFKNWFFDELDGHSTDRVAALLYQAMGMKPGR